MNSLEAAENIQAFRPARWLRKALRSAEAVARIGPGEFANGIGSGFLIDPRHFSNAPWHYARQGALLLTASHVCGTESNAGLAPERAVATFLSVAGKPARRVRRLLATSAPAELDYSILELEGPAVDGVVPLSGLPTHTPVAGDRVSVVGYVLGNDEVQFSIHENRLAEWSDTHLWYSTATELRSSGSPVFDDDWNVIGLHKAFRRPLPHRNEGVRFERIVAAAAES